MADGAENVRKAQEKRKREVAQRLEAKKVTITRAGKDITKQAIAEVKKFGRLTTPQRISLIRKRKAEAKAKRQEKFGIVQRTAEGKIITPTEARERLATFKEQDIKKKIIKKSITKEQKEVIKLFTAPEKQFISRPELAKRPSVQEIREQFIAKELKKSPFKAVGATLGALVSERSAELVLAPLRRESVRKIVVQEEVERQFVFGGKEPTRKAIIEGVTSVPATFAIAGGLGFGVKAGAVALKSKAVLAGEKAVKAFEIGKAGLSLVGVGAVAKETLKITELAKAGEKRVAEERALLLGTALAGFGAGAKTATMKLKPTTVITGKLGDVRKVQRIIIQKGAKTKITGIEVEQPFRPFKTVIKGKVPKPAKVIGTGRIVKKIGAEAVGESFKTAQRQTLQIARIREVGRVKLKGAKTFQTKKTFSTRVEGAEIKTLISAKTGTITQQTQVLGKKPIITIKQAPKPIKPLTAGKKVSVFEALEIKFEVAKKPVNIKPVKFTPKPPKSKIAQLLKIRKGEATLRPSTTTTKPTTIKPITKTLLVEPRVTEAPTTLLTIAPKITSITPIKTGTPLAFINIQGLKEPTLLKTAQPTTLKQKAKQVSALEQRQDIAQALKQTTIQPTTTRLAILSTSKQATKLIQQPQIKTRTITPTQPIKPFIFPIIAKRKKKAKQKIKKRKTKKVVGFEVRFLKDKLERPSKGVFKTKSQAIAYARKKSLKSKAIRGFKVKTTRKETTKVFRGKRVGRAEFKVRGGLHLEKNPQKVMRL